MKKGPAEVPAGVLLVLSGDDVVSVGGEMRVVGVVFYEDVCDVIESGISRNSCHPFVVVIDVVFLSFSIISESDVEGSVVFHSYVVL